MNCRRSQKKLPGPWREEVLSGHTCDTTQGLRRLPGPRARCHPLQGRQRGECRCSSNSNWPPMESQRDSSFGGPRNMCVFRHLWRVNSTPLVECSHILLIYWPSDGNVIFLFFEYIVLKRCLWKSLAQFGGNCRPPL